MPWRPRTLAGADPCHGDGGRAISSALPWSAYEANQIKRWLRAKPCVPQIILMEHHAQELLCYRHSSLMELDA